MTPASPRRYRIRFRGKLYEAYRMVLVKDRAQGQFYGTIGQVDDTGRFWMAIYELNATHPFLSKRVAALRAAKGFATRAAARRPALAYPLAPVLGIAAGGPVLVVVLVTYAAIFASFPKLKKYFMEQQQKAAAAQFQLPDGLAPGAQEAVPEAAPDQAGSAR